jgi:hypothetical protein
MYVHTFLYLYVNVHWRRRLQRVLTSQLIEAKKKQNELLRMCLRPPLAD